MEEAEAEAEAAVLEERKIETQSKGTLKREDITMTCTWQPYKQPDQPWPGS